ncbi:MAG: TIR domain-containing protein, partial [Gammaproteobacteria bacterium]
MPNAHHLFLSYSSRDRDKVRAVHRYLSERGITTFFDQQNLRAGQNWPQALEQALRDSSAVAVFVGAQIGNWQWPEIGFALDRQANDQQFPVIPVLLDGADTSRSFLFLNTWVDLRRVHLADTGALNRLLDAISRPGISLDMQLIDLNPYRGLEIFDEAHSPFFFGREKFVDDLFDRLTQQRKKFVGVIGASGSGKSSVVRAGLVPKLRRRRPPHETWDVAVFTPGERPWFRLADALGPLRFPDKSDTELDIEIDKLASALHSGELSLDSLLDRILQRQGKLHRLLLVVDQFEELFTLTPAQDRGEFINRLVDSLAVEGLVLVPTLRADFYGQAIEANRRLSDILGQEQVTLGRLTAEELSRAVVEPARLARLELDPGLPELLLRDAGNEPGSLPLLQHALLSLYLQRQGNRLTSTAYQAIGGIRKAIANSAEREFNRFEAQGKGALVRGVFTQLVRLARADEGLEDTRRRVAMSALPADARPIVDEFAGYQFRLLVKASERVAASARDESSEQPRASEQETVEVAHEALIREWDRLKSWLNEDRGFYLWRQRLDQASRDYEEHGKEADYVLQGPALKEAEGKLAASMPEPLAPYQRRFIQASLDERDRTERAALAAEAQRRREKEELQQRERDALALAAEQERHARQAAESAQQAELGRRQAAERAKRIIGFGAM